jgi:hypothetical protein
MRLRAEAKKIAAATESVAQRFEDFGR